MDLIRELRQRSDFLIGAGTVLDQETAQQVIAAGAEFLVSPAFVPDIVANRARARRARIDGGRDADRGIGRITRGLAVVKLFPASTVGPAHLKALKSVFPTIPIMPTGGVDAGNLAEWFAAGAACVGVGGKLLDNKAIERGDRQNIIDAGAELLAALQRCRSGPV